MENLESQENEMENLETRMKRVAVNMKGNFKEEHGYGIWHKTFLDWDNTWEAADELGLTEESTDREIELAIRTREGAHYYFYEDKIKFLVWELRETTLLTVDAYDEYVVDAMVAAFKKGLRIAEHTQPTKVKEEPYDDEIRAAAIRVLDLESHDRGIRWAAMHACSGRKVGFKFRNWRACARIDFGKDWADYVQTIYLDPGTPSLYTYVGSMDLENYYDENLIRCDGALSYLAIEDLSLDNALRDCLKLTYVDRITEFERRRFLEEYKNLEDVHEK